MRRHKYRRIKPTPNCTLQGYQLSLIALTATIGLTVLSFFISQIVTVLSSYVRSILFYSIITNIVSILIFAYTWFHREEVSSIEIPGMSDKSKKLAKRLRRLFNDKQITDVLKLSNTTRFGNEMPEIEVWIDEELSSGFIAIENIANWERANREKFEQRVSGILAGKYQRFAVVNSELTVDDSYIVFYFEDSLTSQRLYIESDNSLDKLVHENHHALRLSKDLTWHSDIVPHLSVIARTRAGKSVLAGRYMARLMLLQGWVVEYNSAKYDRYVKEFDGQSIGLFIDELGNLNASLESLDKVDKNLKLTSRWTTAINRLSATGGSAGIHIIAISQYATKEGFLPSLARVNCSDAVIMLGGAADSADERKYLMSGFADLPKRSYGTGQGVARILGSGKKWEAPHFYETPWFKD